MSDIVLIDGDQAIFQGMFAPAMVLGAPPPGVLRASGGATVQGKKVCIDGDEASVAVQGVSYWRQLPNEVPGVAVLKIAALAPNHRALKTRSSSKAVLLKGGNFIAKLEVVSPSQIVPPGASPIPDPMTQYFGQGQFTNAQQKLLAT